MDLFGIRSYLRERGFRARENRQQQFYDGLVEAREAFAVGEYGRSEDLWSKLIQRDPTKVISRLELSKALEARGEPREALKVLDLARSDAPHNVEVLTRNAELHLSLGNKTAAIDNLALVQYHHPNRLTAAKARDLSESVGRIDDAVEYHEKFLELGGKEDPEQPIRARLKLKSLAHQFGEDLNLHAAELRKLLKTYPKYVPVLTELARLERKMGNVDQAANLLVQAAHLEGDSEHWLEASRLWIENGMADRAVAAARTAHRKSQEREKTAIALDLASLYAQLLRFEEAKNELTQIESRALEDDGSDGRESKQRFLVLKGYVLNQLGEYREAASIWKQLGDLHGGDGEFSLPKPTQLGDAKSKSTFIPTPVMSTP